jgi:hypothetical protein
LTHSSSRLRKKSYLRVALGVALLGSDGEQVTEYGLIAECVLAVECAMPPTQFCYVSGMNG